MRTFAAIVLAAVLLIPAASAQQPSPVPAKQQLTAEDAQRSEIGYDQKLDVQVPLDLAFNDEYGKPVKLNQYFGGEKPVILNLVYYQCPMMCTQVLNGLVDALRQVTLVPGKDFEIVTVSFDPAETADLAMQKKKTYLEKYTVPGAADGWHFLTGNEASIKRLTETVGFRYKYDEHAGQFVHASGILVLTPTGKTSKYFYGIAYSPQDVRLGLVDASQNKIGTPVDYLLLLCYHYDPLTGKYSFAIIKMLRLAAALTVFVLAISIGLMLWRERQRRAAEPQPSPQAH